MRIDMGLVSQVVLLAVLLAFNAFFVAAEYSILTLRKTKIDQYVRQRILGYGSVRKALDHLYAIISTTQLGSSLCSILLGWIGEPMIEKALYPLMRLIPLPSTILVNRSISIIITISLLSFLQMIFGEIIPKTIALQKSYLVSRLIILPLNLFNLIFSPFIYVTNGISNIFLKIIHMNPLSKQPTDYTAEEIRTILNESMKNHTLPNHQGHLLTNIITLRKTPITKLMIDKSKLTYFNFNDNLEHIKKKIAENKYLYNRYPVYFSKNLIIGYIHISDILRFPEVGMKDIKLRETGLIREILHINENYQADKLLIQMRQKGIHVAVVKTQEQELLGIVTLTDIIEYLVNHR